MRRRKNVVKAHTNLAVADGAIASPVGNRESVGVFIDKRKFVFKEPEFK